MKAKEEIYLSSFYKNFIASLKDILHHSKKDITEIFCLGLGSISSCKIAQHQLGLLLLLQDQFCCPIEVFDPAFNLPEKEILSELKLKLSTQNCEGKIPSNSSGFTFFILPHCPKELTNNLLFKNWEPEKLANCILYANSFEKIHLDTPLRFLKSYNFLIKSLEVTEELPVPNVFQLTDIFNDLSLHHFPIRLIATASTSFWEAPEPVYPTETELIKDVG